MSGAGIIRMIPDRYLADKGARYTKSILEGEEHGKVALHRMWFRF